MITSGMIIYHTIVLVKYFFISKGVNAGDNRHVNSEAVNMPGSLTGYVKLNKIALPSLCFNQMFGKH